MSHASAGLRSGELTPLDRHSNEQRNIHGQDWSSAFRGLDHLSVFKFVGFSHGLPAYVFGRRSSAVDETDSGLIVTGIWALTDCRCCVEKCKLQDNVKDERLEKLTLCF